MSNRYPPLKISESDHYGFLHEVGLCVVDGSYGPLEVEHLRGADSYLGKPIDGVGMKPHYRWCIPLLAHRHHERHRVGVDIYRRWGLAMDDIIGGALPTALVLFSFSVAGDVDGAREWIQQSALIRRSRAIRRRA